MTGPQQYHNDERTTTVRTASGFRVHKGMNKLFINVMLLVQ